ncbi:hypothetical protein KDZ21_03520 [Lactobacillus crispatus]|uniref:hypothetical protein n=1 Tax=Lactobacillus crispatus TaxID=47770 RepID=UPI001C4DFE98|nr:hypothetical protein [Lactobacillus crispatus]MBW0437283.1 hypothetical protein [Lactobacillus crispatus]MBW0443670.1 hypothetical protein [Lactobacillus crispatus]MBW0455880.1 hypothetical protein [Lactobacillus crispatus]
MAKNNSSSQNELQNAAYHAVENFRRAMFTETECCYIARLVRYDKKKHLADVQPLTQLSEGVDSAQYLDIPVAENCYMIDEMIDALKSEFSKVDTNTSLPEHESTSFVSKLPKNNLLRVGVPVVCAVLDRDNDNWKGGRDASTFMPNTNRTHDANDSIVIGVLGGDWKNG